MQMDQAGYLHILRQSGTKNPFLMRKKKIDEVHLTHVDTSLAEDVRSRERINVK